MAITFIQKIFSVSFCVVMLTQSSCFRDSYEVKVSGPVAISSEWLEFKPDKPLKAEKDLQMILLELEPPLKDDFYSQGTGSNRGKGILMPDGDVINPEIQVVDQYGNAFQLVYSGARQTFSPVYDLPYPNKWPRDRQYTTVKIRSSKPIKCKAIYWFCESAKDLK